MVPLTCCLAVNFSFFHTAQCGNYRNFVKPTALLKKLLKKWFDEIFFWWDTMLGLLKTIFRQIRISKICITYFKLFPTISRGFWYLKMTNLNTFSAIDLPQCFTYNNAFFHFLRNNKVLLSTTFSIYILDAKWAILGGKSHKNMKIQ